VDLEDSEANLKIASPIAQTKSVEMTDAVTPVELVKRSWCARTKDYVSTPVVFPNVTRNSAATMAVEACAEFVVQEHRANLMANAGLVPQIASTKFVGMMAVEVHVATVHWEALAVLKGNVSAHQSALAKNVEMTAVEGCAVHAPGENSAPLKIHVPHAWRIVLASNAEMMAVEVLAANVQTV